MQIPMMHKSVEKVERISTNNSDAETRGSSNSTRSSGTIRLARVCRDAAIPKDGRKLSGLCFAVQYRVRRAVGFPQARAASGVSRWRYGSTTTGWPRAGRPKRLVSCGQVIGDSFMPLVSEDHTKMNQVKTDENAAKPSESYNKKSAIAHSAAVTEQSPPPRGRARFMSEIHQAGSLAFVFIGS